MEKFEKIGQLNNWSNEEKCVQFCLTLNQSAEAWYLNLNRETKESFELLKQSFKSRFSHKTDRVNLYAKFMKIKQDGRDVSVYIEEVETLGRLLKKTEDEIIDRVIFGLDNKLKQQIIIRDITSINELIEFAKKLDTLHASDVETLSEVSIPKDYRDKQHTVTYNPRSREENFRARQQRPGPYRGRQQGKDGLKCHTCGRFGHVSFSCYRNKRCFTCNKMGHVKSQCFKS